MKQLDLGNKSSIVNRAVGLKKSFLKLIQRKNKAKKDGSPKSDIHKR